MLKVLVKNCNNFYVVSAKLCRRGPYVPKGPPDEDWAGTAPPGCACTPSVPAPLRARLEPIFHGLPLTALPTSVVRVWSRFSAPRRSVWTLYEGIKGIFLAYSLPSPL
jgi:hypothetical protein